jgi:hypothetical protein
MSGENFLDSIVPIFGFAPQKARTFLKAVFGENGEKVNQDQNYFLTDVHDRNTIVNLITNGYVGASSTINTIVDAQIQNPTNNLFLFIKHAGTFHGYFEHVMNSKVVNNDNLVQQLKSKIEQYKNDKNSRAGIIYNKLFNVTNGKIGLNSQNFNIAKNESSSGQPKEYKARNIEIFFREVLNKALNMTTNILLYYYTEYETNKQNGSSAVNVDNQPYGNSLVDNTHTTIKKWKDMMKSLRKDIVKDDFVDTSYRNVWSFDKHREEYYTVIDGKKYYENEFNKIERDACSKVNNTNCNEVFSKCFELGNNNIQGCIEALGKNINYVEFLSKNLNKINIYKLGVMLYSLDFHIHSNSSVSESKPTIAFESVKEWISRNFNKFKSSSDNYYFNNNDNYKKASSSEELYRLIRADDKLFKFLNAAVKIVNANPHVLDQYSNVVQPCEEKAVTKKYKDMNLREKSIPKKSESFEGGIDMLMNYLKNTQGLKTVVTGKFPSPLINANFGIPVLTSSPSPFTFIRKQSGGGIDSSQVAGTKLLERLFKSACSRMSRKGVYLNQEDRQRIEEQLKKMHDIENELSKTIYYMLELSKVYNGSNSRNVREHELKKIVEHYKRVIKYYNQSQTDVLSKFARVNEQMEKILNQKSDSSDSESSQSLQELSSKASS